MSASCCDQTLDPHRGNESCRRVLWAVLTINAAMFGVEMMAGLAAGSASLQADALDFVGDAGNYAISLFVVGMALRYRAMAAFLKGATMGVFGLRARRHGLARIAWDTAPRLYDGRGRRRGACRQRGFVWSLVGLPWGRCEHALGMDLHAQRRAR